MSLIEIKNLNKIYQNDGVETVALDNVSFSIAEKEFLAIMGPSGSGKSTLLHVLGFLDRPTSGEYLFAGRDMRQYSEEELAGIRNKDIGFVFQAFNLLPRTTVLENVKLPLIYSKIDESQWHDITMEAIRSVGLEHRVFHESSQLSGGEKQRVAIARALVNKPKIIFADEPTGNLDSKSGGQVMEIIEKLHSLGHTIVLITHETYTAEYSNRIIFMRDGKIESDKLLDKKHHHNGEFRK